MSNTHLYIIYICSIWVPSTHLMSGMMLYTCNSSTGWGQGWEEGGGVETMRLAVPWSETPWPPNLAKWQASDSVRDLVSKTNMEKQFRKLSPNQALVSTAHGSVRACHTCLLMNIPHTHK